MELQSQFHSANNASQVFTALKKLIGCANNVRALLFHLITAIHAFLVMLQHKQQLITNAQRVARTPRQAWMEKVVFLIAEIKYLMKKELNA